jgi:hypothetical protein
MLKRNAENHFENYEERWPILRKQKKGVAQLTE